MNILAVKRGCNCTIPHTCSRIEARKCFLHWLWMPTVCYKRFPWDLQKISGSIFYACPNAAKKAFTFLILGNEMNLCMAVTSMNMEQEYLTPHEVQLAGLRGQPLLHVIYHHAPTSELQYCHEWRENIFCSKSNPHENTSLSVVCESVLILSKNKALCH